MDIRYYATTQRKQDWLNSLKVFLEQGPDQHSHKQRRGFIGSCIYRFSHSGFPLKLMSEEAFKRRKDRLSRGLRPIWTSDHVYSLNRVSEYLIKHFDSGINDWDDTCNELPFLLTTIEVSPSENNRLGVAQRGGKRYDIQDLFDMKHYKDCGIKLLEIPDKLKKDGTPKRGATYYDDELRTDKIKDLII